MEGGEVVMIWHAYWAYLVEGAHTHGLKDNHHWSWTSTISVAHVELELIVHNHWCLAAQVEPG